MLKLTRLKIDKYRRVAPGTELVFDDGFNVLLGRNGTGKTTLLKLISMCLRSDFSELAQEEVAIAYELRGDDLEVSARLENRKRELDPAMTSLAAQLTGSGAPFPGAEQFEHDADFEVRIPTMQKAWRFRSTPTAAAIEDINAPGEEQVMRGYSPFLASTFPVIWFLLAVKVATSVNELSLVSSARHQGDNSLMKLRRFVRNEYRFDESLNVFSVMEGRRREGNEGNASASQSVLFKFEEGQLVVGQSDFVPAAVESFVSKWLFKFEDATEITITHEALPFLSAFVSSAGFRAAEMKMSLLNKDVQEETTRWTFGDFKFLLHFGDGSVITHDLMSYGQKRLLGFLYYVDCNEIVIADELVNGLHHEWIEACIDAIGQRQAFLTSQNPLLLDYLSFDSAEQAARSFILCRSEVTEGRQQMRWANMPKDDAEAFYRGYLAGIQHVSEILRTEGLW